MMAGRGQARAHVEDRQDSPQQNSASLRLTPSESRRHPRLPDCPSEVPRARVLRKRGEDRRLDDCEHGGEAVQRRAIDHKGGQFPHPNCAALTPPTGAAAPTDSAGGGGRAAGRGSGDLIANRGEKDWLCLARSPARPLARSPARPLACGESSGCWQPAVSGPHVYVRAVRAACCNRSETITFLVLVRHMAPPPPPPACRSAFTSRSSSRRPGSTY